MNQPDSVLASTAAGRTDSRLVSHTQGQKGNIAETADLPIEQSARFKVDIHLKTAIAMGLAIPLPLRRHPAEVIE